MCNEQISDEHGHVVNVESRSLLCTCRKCSLLFTVDGAGGGRYRAVPDRYAAIDGFAMSDGTWDSFQIPVSMAFFFRDSSTGQVAAFYPSPAGATESLLDLDAWTGLAAANPVVDSLAPDVEALLLRVRPEGTEAYLVPIDACYELVGHMRRVWRGFDGGREAKDTLDGFFAGIRGRCR